MAGSSCLRVVVTAGRNWPELVVNIDVVTRLAAPAPPFCQYISSIAYLCCVYGFCAVPRISILNIIMAVKWCSIPGKLGLGLSGRTPHLGPGLTCGVWM